MESIRTFLFLIFGSSLLPKIYSDTFPPLFLKKKPYHDYILVDKFQYTDSVHNNLAFWFESWYRLYNACPEENAPFHPLYALKAGNPVTYFEAKPLEQFVEGYFNNLNCNKPIKPIALKHKLGFKDEFVVAYDIGYLIHEINNNFKELWKDYENMPEVREYAFFKFLGVVMNKQTGMAIEVAHSIVSAEFLKPESTYSGTLPSNEKNGDFYEFDLDSLYTKMNQTTVFYSIFEEFHTHYYNHSDKFLLKVQLAPHEDFLLNTWKLASFADLNTTAMWVQLYRQWRTLEIFVRKVARELGNLTIETGVSRTLALLDANKQEQFIYLREGQKSPVAQLVWKLVKYNPINYDDDNNAVAILIVMHNDPYTPDQKPICKDVGKSLGWMVSNSNHETGLTYVCPVIRSVMSKLHDEYNQKYEVFNLKDMFRLKYHEEGEGVLEFSFEDTYSKIV